MAQIIIFFPNSKEMYDQKRAAAGNRPIYPVGIVDRLFFVMVSRHYLLLFTVLALCQFDLLCSQACFFRSSGCRPLLVGNV